MTTEAIHLPIHQHLRCGDDAPPHCSACRADREWRRSLVAFFGGPVDFACPRGLAIVGEATDETLPAPERPARPARNVRPSSSADPFTEEVAAVRRKEAAVARQAEQHGPGSLLSAMIRAATGIDSARCASCDARVKQMNAWGWTGCIAHARTIYGWLRDECKARGIAPDRRMIWKAIKGALRRPNQEKGHESTEGR